MAWNKTVIINSSFSGIDDLDVREESRAKAQARKSCFYVGEFLKKYVPSFEDAFIISTTPDLG